MSGPEENPRARAGRYPPIVLSVSDHRRLQIIALEALMSDPRNAGALLDEIDRAAVVEDGLIDEQVVRLGDLVSYRDGLTGEQHLVQLVDRPVDPAGATALSVRSSSGAALVGLRVGQSILWSDRLGTERTYTILDVVRGQPRTRGVAVSPRQAGESDSVDDGKVMTAN